MKIANMIILIILIIVLLLSFSYIKNLFKNDVTILDDVKLKEEEPKKKGFALMLEQDDGKYKESDSSGWPTDMVFNSELSGCIDIDGNIIENSLSFDSTTNVVTVSTNKTAYCYVYFDLKPTLAEYLINNVSSSVLWNSTLEDDGYRYVGTDPANYICFGTTDKDTCASDTDKYMYRIIGIFADSSGNQHVKLIKKEALNTAYAWHSDVYSDVAWNNSDLYNGINGSYFKTNTSYPYMQDSTWTNKIATWTYTMTNTKTEESSGPVYYSITTQQLYLHELNRSGKTNTNGTWTDLSTKISLMYVSDFQLSLGSSALSYTSSANASTLKTGWMHISNNDSGTPSINELTMSRSGSYSSGYYYAWSVDSSGIVYDNGVDYASAVRPVFYLESNEIYNGGSGTIEDPIMLSAKIIIDIIIDSLEQYYSLSIVFFGVPCMAYI